MATEPVTLFAHTPNPRVVIDVLKTMGVKFKVVGPEDAWSEIIVTTGGWLKSKRLKLTHDPAYYTGPGWQAQMQGMHGYFSRFARSPERATVLALIGQFGFAIGTICDPAAAAAGDERYSVLAAIAAALDAVWFTPSSLRDAQGRILFGAGGLAPEAGARWPAYTPAVPDGDVPDGDVPDDDALALKQRVFIELESFGFQPANTLPLPDLYLDVRAPYTLCTRLMALQAVFAWAAAPEDVVPTADLRDYIKRSNLRAAMTESERAVIDLPRAEARAQHQDRIGWKLENIWALAWVAGFEDEPTLDAGQIPDPVIQALLFDFLPDWDEDTDDFMERVAPRPAHDVICLEYKFYCAHNAVRSAQLGQATVPAGFDPIAHGGAVHERRHALTWSLSPGDDWDETDLST